MLDDVKYIRNKLDEESAGVLEPSLIHLTVWRWLLNVERKKISARDQILEEISLLNQMITCENMSLH